MTSSQAVWLKAVQYYYSDGSSVASEDCYTNTSTTNNSRNGNDGHGNDHDEESVTVPFDEPTVMTGSRRLKGYPQLEFASKDGATIKYAAVKKEYRNKNNNNNNIFQKIACITFPRTWVTNN